MPELASMRVPSLRIRSASSDWGWGFWSSWASK
jgi:hypothetical protein